MKTAHYDTTITYFYGDRIRGDDNRIYRIVSGKRNIFILTPDGKFYVKHVIDHVPVINDNPVGSKAENWLPIIGEKS